MRWHVEQSTNRKKAKECDLGPLPTLEPNFEDFLRVKKGGANCLKSPLWRTTKSGVERLPPQHTKLVGRAGGHP